MWIPTIISLEYWLVIEESYEEKEGTQSNKEDLFFYVCFFYLESRSVKEERENGEDEQEEEEGIWVDSVRVR